MIDFLQVRKDATGATVVTGQYTITDVDGEPVIRAFQIHKRPETTEVATQLFAMCAAAVEEARAELRASKQKGATK